MWYFIERLHKVHVDDIQRAALVKDLRPDVQDSDEL